LSDIAKVVAKDVFEKMSLGFMLLVFISGLTIFYLTPIKSLLNISETIWNPFVLTSSGEILPIQEILGRMVIILLLSTVPGVFGFFLATPLTDSVNHKIKNFFLVLLHKSREETKLSESGKLEPRHEIEFGKFIDENPHIHKYLNNLTMLSKIFNGLLVGAEISIATSSIGLIFYLSGLFFGVYIQSFDLILFCTSLLVFGFCWYYNKRYFHKFIGYRWQIILDNFNNYLKTQYEY
jgi:hypothetical protein